MAKAKERMAEAIAKEGGSNMYKEQVVVQCRRCGKYHVTRPTLNFICQCGHKIIVRPFKLQSNYFSTFQL